MNKTIKTKAKLLRMLTSVSNEIEKRKRRIEEAKRIIAKQKVLKEDLVKMYNELETLVEFTKHVEQWFEEVGEYLKQEAGVE